MLQSGWCRVLKIVESSWATHLVSDNPQDEGVQFSWGVCPLFLQAMSSGKKVKAQMTSLGGTLAFLAGCTTAGVSPVSTVCFFWRRRCSSWTAKSPNFLANQRSVSQQSWSLWGVTSWARRRLRSSLTLLSFQGIGRFHLSICSKTRHLWRSVRKRVSPRRSWNSCSSLSPPRGARCAISPAWGIRCANKRSAHFLLKWPSKTFWLIGPNSLMRDGFQCLHLTSLRSVIGAGIKLFSQRSLSTISQRSCLSE